MAAYRLIWRRKSAWTGATPYDPMEAGERHPPVRAMGFYQDRIVPQLVNLGMRNRQLAPYRERIVRRAEGRVLEVGVGSGLNLPLYTHRVSEVLGLDPHPKLLGMATHKAAIVPSKLIEGSAESIPLDRASVDTVLTTWTLCSIPDVVMALSEMRRILKPNGQLLFVEHGLASDERVRRWQNRLTPVWRRIAGGCHLNRPIATLVEDAGFHISQMDSGYMPGPKPMTFMYEGSARLS
jgi:SAM-dependent methyltransferase